MGERQRYGLHPLQLRCMWGCCCRYMALADSSVEVPSEENMVVFEIPSALHPLSPHIYLTSWLSHLMVFFEIPSALPPLSPQHTRRDPFVMLV
eukprot:808969-Prorocentrum_minimum.AAC.1